MHGPTARGRGAKQWLRNDLALVARRDRLLLERNEGGFDVIVDAPVQRLELERLKQHICADLAAVEIGEDG